MKSINQIFNNKRISFLFFLFLNIFIINEVNSSYLEFSVDYLPNKNYKFLKENDNLQNKEKEEFMKALFFKHLITNFEIGTPAKNQMLLINTDSNEFYLDTLTPPETVQQECRISEFFQFETKEFYSEV